MAKCKFKNVWLIKKDKNKNSIGSWASQFNETEAFCKVCDATFDFSNKGFHAFIQHSNTMKHKKCAIDFSNQTTLVATASSLPAQIQLFSSKNAATVAELIWVMKSVCCNYSASSCHNIKDTFAAMFPEGMPKDFTLSPKKMNYLITDALSPYFQDMLLKDIDRSFFTICFDETTNVEDKKELQIAIRYWSETKGEAVTRHLQTYFMGKADAQALFEKINCAIENANLPLQKLLIIGSDGPNVNKRVDTLFNESLLEIRTSGLIDLGTCPIHIVHNAYLKALTNFGENASDLAVSVYHYFNGWPARCEDFEKIQEELNLPIRKFLKHSPSRWLSFYNAAERLLQQWDSLTNYFLKFIPLKKTQAMQSASFRRISNLLREPTIKAEIYFTMSSADLFTTFTETFQNDEPLVHLMYLELQELAEKLARRVCKNVDQNKNYDKLFQIDNILPIKDIIVSEEVKKELSPLSEKTALTFLRNAKDHYIAGCEYIIKKELNSSNFQLAKYLKCLNPTYIKKTKSCEEILKIARKLPISVKEDVLMDEFKILQLEVQPLKDQERIDHYWQKNFIKEDLTGRKKFVELSKIVKAALSLSHGNANIERRFSVSKLALTDEKASTKERTFNSILTIKDALKTFSNKPELVPITSKLISMAQNAHKHYTMFIEEKKRLKEMEERKKEEIRLATETKEKEQKAEASRKKIHEIEDKISKFKKEHKIAFESSTRLFKEANDRLKKAVEKGDMSEISVAQGMLEGILSMRKTEIEKLKEVETLQKNVEKRKNNMITFFAKKPKMT